MTNKILLIAVIVFVIIGCNAKENNEHKVRKSIKTVKSNNILTQEFVSNNIFKVKKATCKNTTKEIDKKILNFEDQLNKHIKADHNLYNWTNLPYSGRVEAAMKKMKELPETKKEEFANWHEWHDPRVGFVLYSELAENKICTSVYEKIYLYSGAVCCLGSIKEYDKAWNYINKNLVDNNNTYEDAWMCGVIADVAQHRGDYKNEKLFTRKAWELVSQAKDNGKVNVDVSEAAQGYCIALCNAEDYIRLNSFINQIENNNNIDNDIKKWLQNINKKVKKYNGGKEVYLPKYKTRSWPSGNDVK